MGWRAREILLAAAGIALCFTVAAAEEMSAGEEEIGAAEVYTYPEIPHEAQATAGYSFAGSDGSARAAEYEYLRNSAVFKGEFRAFLFPHRIHLDLDVKNSKDFFASLDYAYKDTVLFRGISRSLFHNLDTVPLPDLDPSTASPRVDVQDPGWEYGTRSGMHTAFLRLKTPDFPFHVYLDGALFEKKGTQQQRFLLEAPAAEFNDLVKVSRTRRIDWRASQIFAGANSHLGPFEVDFAHGEKRFSPGGDRVLADSYGRDGLEPNVTRGAGTFSHNLIPELRSSSNTVKVHTSYTGRIVAAATFSKVDRENRDSRTTAEVFVAAGEVTWIPAPHLAVFLKYRHRDNDVDNPETVVVTDIADPSRRYTYAVKNAVSSSTDTLTGTIRYRLLPGVTMRAEYGYEDIERRNAAAWRLPESTTRQGATLSLDLRVVKGITFKMRHTRREITDPAYNNEPNRGDETRASLAWIPVPRVNALLSCSRSSEKRDDLLFLDGDEIVMAEAKNRDVRRDRCLGSLTVMILKDLSVTGTYSYFRNRTRQDIVSISSDASVADFLVPYKDQARTYAVDIRYLPRNALSLGVGINHTQGTGLFYPAAAAYLDPESIAALTELRIRETAYTVSGEYKLKNGYGIGLRYRYSRFTDVLNNPYDEGQDGTAGILLVTVTKRW